MNRNIIVVVRYYIIAVIIIGIIISNKDISSFGIIMLLLYLINNQLRFFSLDHHVLKIISLLFEIFLSILMYKYIGGYILTYMLLSAIDANISYGKKCSVIFDALIIITSIALSTFSNIETLFLNAGTVTAIIAILYFVKGEDEKKLKVEQLNDEFRTSQLKLKKANKDLEQYASSIEELTLLRERNRLSREIHDSVGHALSTIGIQLGAVEKTIDSNPKAALELTKALRSFTQDSLNDVRKAVRAIKPGDFDEYEGIFAIEELINNYKKMTGVDVRLSFTKEKWALNQDQSFVLYRVIQEFLVNSVRHGKATIVKIMLSFNHNMLSVTLKDNGIGSDTIIEGIGLKSMRERVGEIGGTIEYNSVTGEGFLVRLEINKKEKPKIHNKGDIYGKN